MALGLMEKTLQCVVLVKKRLKRGDVDSRGTRRLSGGHEDCHSNAES